jgi:peptidoglycan hydrolase-like protein with peptidoglycan-binding domain
VVALAALLTVVPITAPLLSTPDSVDAAGVPELGSCRAQPELSRGDRGPGVSCLQFALIVLGFPIEYSGEFDAATENAVRWFQASIPGLTADGRAGDQTLLQLGIHAAPATVVAAVPPPTTAPTRVGTQPPSSNPVAPPSPRCQADANIEPNERGQSVGCLQRRLTELGLFSGSITGLADRTTIDGVRAFQRATPPLRVDGVAGPRTLAALGIWSGVTSGNGRFTGPGPFPAPMQNEPQWVLTPDGIPKYGNRTACTASEAAVIAAEFAHDGADVATQQWAVYVASREGGCRFDAVNLNMRTRDDSHCTFQINVLAGVFEPTGVLGRRGWTADNVKSSLQACADAASDFWVWCGRGPWIPPYSCTPPWEGARQGQPPPPTTTTTVPPAEVPPVEVPAPDVTPPTVPEITPPTAPTPPTSPPLPTLPEG